MLKYKTLVLGAALGFGLTAPGLAQDTAADTTADTVVATVNGTDLTVGHLIAMMSTLSEQQMQLSNDVLFEGLLERLIQQTAISDSEPDLSLATKLQLENEKSALNASEIVEELAAAIEVTDEMIQTAYNLEFADFTPSKEFEASHILVATEDEAKAIITELKGGADFAEMAKAKSTGPTGPNGGNLGWFGEGRMVPEFEAAVVKMEKGQVSEPVQTQFGWHVIKLNDTRIPQVPTLDDKRTELQQTVWRTELMAGIEALVSTATIERPDISGIDPSILRDFSLIAK